MTYTDGWDDGYDAGIELSIEASYEEGYVKACEDIKVLISELPLYTSSPDPLAYFEGRILSGIQDIIEGRGLEKNI